MKNKHNTNVKYKKNYNSSTFYISVFCDLL